MTQYGIGVTKNRFELFDNEDEDPLEVLKVKEQEREARKKTKLSEKENKAKEPVAPKPKQTTGRKGIKDTQNVKSQELQKAKEDSIGKGPRLTQRTERPERRFTPDQEKQNRFNREERAPERKEEKGERKETRSARPLGTADSIGDSRGGRGRGGGAARGGLFARGGRGGRTPRAGFDTRRKREFERQSGSDKTGVKPVDKREGSGAHNWGSHKDDLEDIRSAGRQEDPHLWNSSDKQDDVPNDTIQAPPEETETNVVGTEEEPKELTLDEWKALKGPRQKPVYNLRKAGEGEDPSQWKKMYALQKKKDEVTGEEEDDEEYESCEYPQRVGRQKHVLEIDIHFKDARSRGRGGRGGRGGPRLNTRTTTANNPTPDKFKDIDESKKAKSSAPKVDDEHDFPSLSTNSTH